MTCSKCGEKKWGSAACPMDDDCPKVREINNRYLNSRPPGSEQAQPILKEVESALKAEPHRAAVYIDKDFEDEGGTLETASVKPRAVSPSVLAVERRAMTVEAIRRLEELDEFLMEALSDSDRAEGRGLVQRVIRALDIPKDVETSLSTTT